MLTYPDIDPVLISLGPLKIHWYGMMYLLSFALGFIILTKRSRYPGSPVKTEQVEDLIIYGAFGVILGGRFGYVLFYNFDQFLQDPLWLLKVWDGGMSFHGGMIGVMIAMALYARRIKCSYGAMTDFVVPLIPMGLGFGRVGNFINQELWGRATDGPWGMVFPNDPYGLPRHASQLYEAFLEGLVCFVILYWFASKPRPRYAVSALFLILYGFFRFIVEFVREPDGHIGFDLFGWMSRGQLLSLPMVLAGLALFYWAYKSEANQGKLSFGTYIDHSNSKAEKK